ncbi:AIPR family protein [Archangium lansingense]|uniref:AIPR family protein n=1 Tax=Archangium lansingense TaxID=2995310 RepID=A0ABT3ZZK1_9BACT|nr:AIPR family protein [Archangium lansinium]MCY1074825.1 AIPR family protein [Archangium lansinium]
MTLSPELLDFARGFHAEIVSHARGEPTGNSGSAQPAEFKENAFTERVVEIISEVGAINDGHTVYFRKELGNRQLKVNGYSVHENEEQLDIITSLYRDVAEPESLRMTEVYQGIQHALNFVQAAAGSLSNQMEDAHPAYDMADRIKELFSNGRLQRVNVVVLTDCIVREYKLQKPLKVAKHAHIDVRADIWDIERLHRSLSSGRAREAIEIDFVEEFGCPIPCLPVPISEGEYGAYLAVVPGDVLHKLYDEYGERLLELNVRSFLQARGKINRGIRDTILKEPQLFFAYNNGLTAVAEEVKTGQLPDGTPSVTWVKGLQIVNGGQTTASLHRAGKKDQADLSRVYVQMKLSEVKTELLETLVPRISLYANSQNKVNEADFSANDPFHQRLEGLSRTIWAPGEQSRWFYERARGQYLVARAKAVTLAQQRQFDSIHPTSQMFTKTDLAVFEHSWGQLPHLVSKGAQKNFVEFTIRFEEERPDFVPDESYFFELVAKAIIFRRTQSLAREARVGAYRANIVTYTVAYLASRTAEQLDLAAIWRAQKLSPRLEDALRGLISPIEEAIKSNANGRNVTEWCKKEECWEAIKGMALPLPSILEEPVAKAARNGKKVSLSEVQENLRKTAVPELVRAVNDALSRLAREGRGRDAVSVADALAKAFEPVGLEVINKVPAKGALWVVGGVELTLAMKEVRQHGLSAGFSEAGGKATGHRPAWFINC